MPEPLIDETKVIKDALQEFYERTGIRITDLDVRWAVGAGCAEVVEVKIRGEQP